MRLWETASLVFFVYVAAAAVAPGRPRVRRLAPLLAGTTAGFLFVLVVSRAPYLPALHDWIAPPIALLLGYWTSGLLFDAPRPHQERLLIAIDDRLAVLDIARRLPKVAAALLEIAYAGVYPIIPIALVLHLWLVPAADPEHFWTVILLTDYICFAFLAWVQTRPPRALEAADPWLSPIRRFNLRLLGAASIQANTFPSGHAAEALAAALLVIGAPVPLVAAMFSAALAISAGAVFGRYHYAADALAGWAVALAVWVALA